MAVARIAAWRDIDLARVKLADGKDGFKRSWIMLMPEGDFEHPQYGKLEFTRKKLQEFKANFDNHVRKIDIALDQDHDGGKATGWLEQLQLRDGGLYGLVRWTSLGAQLLSDQIYRYFSPEFGKFTDPESGKTFSNVIIGGALTNRPFLKNMPAVQLKAKFERPGQYTKRDREKIADADFAGPNKTFPIATQQDVQDAARLIGHAANPAAVKARIKAIARRKGFSLPAAWAESDVSDSGTAAASERNAAVTTRKATRKLADPEPEADDEQEQVLDETETDEQEDALDVTGEEGADVLDEEDGDDDEDDEGQTFADKKTPFKGAAKPFGKGGKRQPAADDAEDEADDGDDENAEELDDMTSDDEEYDEANADDEGEEEEAPPAKSKAGKGKGMPVKKMTEPQLQAEVARLREESRAKDEQIKTLREEQFKLGVTKRLSEITRGIRKDGEDEEFALPRSIKLAYQEFMFEYGIRLSETALTKLDDLVEKSLRLGTVPLTSLANQIKSDNVRDMDDRRPRTSAESVDQTPEAEKIALSEFKMPLSELARKDPDKAQSIYMRLEEARKRHGKPAA